MKRRRLLGHVLGQFLGWTAAFCYGLCSPQARAGLALGTAHEQAAQLEEWRALQRLRGHFDGAPWNDAVDRWQGRKHQLMQALAARLVQGQASESQVLQTLGRADTVLRPRDAAHAKVALEWRPEAPSETAVSASAPPGTATATAAAKTATAQATFWLYRWRGTHDQLVLSMQGGRVKSSGWLHAYE